MSSGYYYTHVCMHASVYELVYDCLLSVSLRTFYDCARQCGLSAWSALSPGAVSTPFNDVRGATGRVPTRQAEETQDQFHHSPT